MTDYHYYEPSAGHGLSHNPLNSIVAPRPIGWMSTRSASGHVNLAPYSFFNLLNYDPPILGFSGVAWKDSIRNASETSEFVWNLVTEDLAEKMNQTSASVPHDVDEFGIAGLTPVSGRKVNVPRVGESRVAMECKVMDIIQYRRQDGSKVQGWLVLGEVVAVYIDQALIKDGLYQTALARPILRMGGRTDYMRVTQDAIFQMQGPASASWSDPNSTASQLRSLKPG